MRLDDDGEPQGGDGEVMKLDDEGSIAMEMDSEAAKHGNDPMSLPPHGTEVGCLRPLPFVLDLYPTTPALLSFGAVFRRFLD